MFCSPILPYTSWIVSYGANGVSYWTPLIYYPVQSNEPPSSKPKPDKVQILSNRIRIGNWEEIYDVVDGTKTWYNTVTKKTTNNDPFV